MKTEYGVMVMKNGKAWGIVDQDGHYTRYGWIDPEDAEVHDPLFCTRPTDVTWPTSPYVSELATAKLCTVVKTIEVYVKED